MKNETIFKSLCNDYRIAVRAVRDDIIRIQIDKGALHTQAPSVLVKEDILSGAASLQERTEDKAYIFDTAKVSVHVDRRSGFICVKNRSSNEFYLQNLSVTMTEYMLMRYVTEGDEQIVERVKTVDGERNFIKNLKQVPDHKSYRAKVHFAFADNEGIYGFGQAEEGIYDYRGKHQYLYQHNMRIPMPVFYSDRGYGIFFDCCSLMTFRDDCEGSYLLMDAVPTVDFYILLGDDPDGVIDGVRYLTGKAAMLPKWAFGYVQSKEQYYSAKELADVVKRYRECGVGIDCVVQDWNSWEPGNWGEKILDRENFGDAKEQLSKIREMNAHAMISVWPNMNYGGKNHTQFAEAGFLLNDLATYNAFSEEARAMYFAQAKEGLMDQGFEAWWCDSTEPFSGPDWNGEEKREAWERFALVGEEHKKFLPQEYANIYALMHAKGIYENQRKVREDIRVMNLTRSGYLSGQQYGAMLWSGDICATYESMKTQITEGLNMSLSGYPYWTLDIGGFFVVNRNWRARGCRCSEDSTMKWFWRGGYEEGIEDLGFRELYVRFIELGVFLPMMRSHGTDAPREIWNFGEKGTSFYDAIEKQIALRYSLMPYIYSLAGMVRLKNDTMMRSLLFDFSQDKRARKICDEFMFGRSLLVCPVTEALYYEAGSRPVDRNKVKKCYLPGQCDWYLFETGERYEGGKEYEIAAPLDHIPVFVRGGSIIPMKPGMQYCSDCKDKPIELHVYPGADAKFTLYEDEENNYNYENGAYSLIDLKWRDKERVFNIAVRQGAYEGMPMERDFILKLQGEKPVRVSYSGQEISISF